VARPCRDFGCDDCFRSDGARSRLTARDSPHGDTGKPRQQPHHSAARRHDSGHHGCLVHWCFYLRVESARSPDWLLVRKLTPMDLLANLALGFSVVLTPENLLFCLIGCFVGTAIGVLPGVGPVATI